MGLACDGLVLASTCSEGVRLWDMRHVRRALADLADHGGRHAGRQKPRTQLAQIIGRHQDDSVGGAIGLLLELGEDRPTLIGALAQDDHAEADTGF